MHPSQSKKRRLVVTLHMGNDIREEPIDDVESVHTDPRGTKIETEDDTYFYSSEEYEKVVTEWEHVDVPNRLIKDYE